MVGILEPSVFVCAVLVQLLGLASVFCARLSERSWAQCLCQRVFYGCLVLVGCATVAALLLGSGYWASCGATLAIMAVGVTFDLGRAGHEALV
jgi:hypothetical protein